MSNKLCAFAGCEKSSHALGLCSSHYKQQRKGRALTPLGGTSLTAGMSLEQRFWAKVNKTEACWEWTGAKTTAGGYGHIKISAQETNRAHRLAYEMTTGPIPEGMQVDHMCHNHACVKPSHLQVATQKENNENLPGAKRTSGTGIRGVHAAAGSSKFYARVTHNYQTYHLGRFGTIEEAEAAVIAKRNELFTNNLLDRVTG